MLLALFGLTAGQAVVWYTGQFYALFFLEKTLKVDGVLTNKLVAIALLLGTPFFVLFGWLSDKIGRKPIILAGCLLAALTYFPLFKAADRRGQPGAGRGDGQRAGDGGRRSRRLLVPVRSGGQDGLRPSCDLAKSYLAKAGVPYANQAAPAGDHTVVRIGGARSSFSGERSAKAEFKTAKAAWTKTLGAALEAAGYPAKADPRG